MWNDRDLTLMKTQQESAMPESVTITRVTTSSDNYGGWTESTTTSTAKGRFGSMTGVGEIEREIAGRLNIDQPVMVVVPAGTDVIETDRLTISSVEYEVGSVLSKSKATALRLICKKL